MTSALSLASCLTIPPHVLSRTLQDEMVVLNIERGMYFGLDEVGTRIWSLLGEGRSLGDVVATIVDEYDVGDAQGVEDVLALARQLLEHGLVEVTH
jgi:hypothetical protein